MYFFFHIPKTAGTSVRTALKAWFRVIADAPLTAKERQELDLTDDTICIAGHVGGAVFRSPGASLVSRYPSIVKSKHAKVFTFLRDPIEQAISFYFHERSRGNIDQSLEQFLLMGHEYQYSRVFGADIDIDELIASFFFWGTTENLQLSLDRLASMLGRSKAEVPTLNVRSGGAAKHELDASFLRRLEKVYAREYELYERVRKLDLDSSIHRPYAPERQFLQYARDRVIGAASPIRKMGFRSVSGVAEIIEVMLHDEQQNPTTLFGPDDPIGITVQFTIGSDEVIIEPALYLSTAQGDTICSIAFAGSDGVQPRLCCGEHRATAWLPRSLLNVGIYGLGVSLSAPKQRQRVAETTSPIGFEITEEKRPGLARGRWTTPFPGPIRPHVCWTLHEGET